LFLEGNAAHPGGCDSLLQIKMAVWRNFFEFEVAVWQPLLTIMFGVL
jgi:hypothetical protein